MNRPTVDLVLTQILRAAKLEQFAVLAYCFMPDHLHLLVEALGESSNGLRLIARAKQLSGFYYRESFGRRLWQRYGFEHVLRDDEDTRKAARYIFENPVRAGLVRCAEEYPFHGSEMYSVAAILEYTSG